MRHNEENFIILLIYVDDVILAGNNLVEMETLKVHLNNKFQLKDLGDLKHYAFQMLEDLGHLGCKPVNTPMEANLKLSQDEEDRLADPKLCRRAIGKLQYLTITRLDISFSVNKLSQFLVTPKAIHMKATERVLQYVKNCPGQGLFFPATSEIQLKAYTNADWGTYPDTRRSTTGIFIFLGQSLIS
ncbi:uncharacterized mitochondrial protein AtMg00810-like [Cannabis sativa]|uniref:uncharacterized mitochondrial protein AtMg00810-like n=1 Tax=Cannabis sativa TaxID=3483 RepID=UPI0029CA867D|nr:uncharacterized mitochondrial protein AtMg00810-like [Cannabis sativa]